MGRRFSSGISFLITSFLVALLFLYLIRHPKPHPERVTSGVGPHPRGRSARSHNSPQHSETGQRTEGCSDLGLSGASDYFHSWQPPDDATCTVSMRNSYPIPDPRRTPGGVDPSITAEMLKEPRFRTRCVRNLSLSATPHDSAPMICAALSRAG
jgi:hypothetical protein